MDEVQENHKEDVRKLVEMMQKEEEEQEEQRDRVAPNMGAGGSYPQGMSVPERRETQGMRWADCEDEEGKEEEEREQDKETGQELTSEKPPKGKKIKRRERRRREKKRGLRKSEREREARAQEERREEREVEAQEGHEGEEETTTQEECVEAKKKVNSMHEANDVSNRHDMVEKRLVEPCGQRTTHADGERASTNLARGREMGKKRKKRRTEQTVQ